MLSNIKITSDEWTVSVGEDLQKCVTTRKIAPESFELPNIDEIVDEERASLFVSETIQPCNILVEVAESFFAHYVAIITDCPTLELFTGVLDEYHGTYNGELVDNIEGSRIYRFDVELSKETSVSKFNLKFMPKNTEMWIYGMIIAVKSCVSKYNYQPSKFDFKHIENILTSCGRDLTPQAQKFKEFLSAYASSKNSPFPPHPNLETAISLAVNLGNAKLNNATIEPNANVASSADEAASAEISQSSDMYQRLTNYIDNKLEEIEKRMEQRLIEIESRLNVKLDNLRIGP